VADPSYEFYNPVIYQQWLFTAHKIERDPSLLEIPLANIARWITSRRLGNVQPLEQWREIVLEAQHSREGLAKLLELLRSDDEESRRMKSCSPFPGVLTKEERRQFTCSWTH
jgi:hypothetical protein